MPHKFLKSSKKRHNISMNKQLTFSLISDELAQAKTSKKEFLEKIERIIPFDEWIEIIRPCYYKGEHGNKPYDLELMLRIFLLQNLYDLSDMKVMNEVIDSRAFSDFCGVDSPDQVPDGDTIGRFRNILVENGLQENVSSGNRYSQQKRLDIKAWNDSGFHSYCCAVIDKEHG